MMKKICKNKNGMAGSVLVVFSCIAILMFVYICMVFFEAVDNIENVSAASQSSLDTYTSQQSVEINSSIKNGHSYTDQLDQSFFTNTLFHELNLDENGTCYYSNGNIKYHIDVLSLSFSEPNQLQTMATIQVHYPIYFFSQQAVVISNTIRVKSDFSLKP